MIIKNIIQGKQIDQIGLIPDLVDVIQYLNEAQNLSNNLLQVYDPYKDKYLQWISDIGLDTLFSSPITELEYTNSLNASNNNVIPISTKTFDEKYSKTFREIIQCTVFEAGEDNAATKKFADLLTENKDAALKLVCEYFIQSFNDERMCVKLLSLLSDYSYNDLYPYSQTIALSSLSNKSSRVKSAAYNMFAHWGNAEALDLLNSTEPPAEAWIRKKYYTIKSTLEERCCMFVK